MLLMSHNSILPLWHNLLLFQQNNGDLDDSLNVSIKRTTIIKANLMSKTMSMLLEENQNLPVATNDSSIEPEKKKDSPKKPFSILQVANI